MELSPEMERRIAEFMADRRLYPRALPAAVAFFHGILVEWLAAANSDAQAQRLLRMIEDVAARGFDADILRALAGRDEFQLLGRPGDG